MSDRIDRAPHQAMSATAAARYVGVDRAKFRAMGFPCINPGDDGQKKYSAVMLDAYQLELAQASARKVTS